MADEPRNRSADADADDGMDGADGVLADCLRDYHARRLGGAEVRAEEFRERAGESWEEFLEILSAEKALDDVLEPAPPQTLPAPFGEYTLQRELGRGAMGVVYEAMHRRLQRTVAVKVLRTGFDTEPTALARFRREARACAQVRHPNIVEIFDAGEVDGRPFYSMAILEGESLHELARRGAAPAPAALAEGLAGVADALAALHAAGIVHRDVKPSNIMVRPDGRMVLADFGLAREVRAEKLTATGQALGTPLYMSPEQLLGSGGPIDGRTDVYALGATAYEVLAGRPVFQADDMVAMLRSVLQDRPVPLRRLRAEIPRDFETVVMKALEKRREDRYPSAAELRDDLRALASGGDVAGRPVGPAVRALRGLSARWPVAAGIAAAAATALAATAWWSSTRPGTLIVECIPVASVAVDGESRGSTPLEIEVAAGPHELTLEQEGFGARTARVEVGAGGTHSVTQMLVARDPDDPDALAKLGAALELSVGAFEPVSETRSGDDRPVTPVFPRGRVRREDLVAWRVDVSADFEPGGTLFFRRGGKDLLARKFEPEELTTQEPFPSEVLSALKAGDKVTWGYQPPAAPKSGPAAKAKPFTAEFELTDGPSKRRLDRLDDLARDQPRAGEHLRAQLYLDERLYLAAYRAAGAIVEGVPESERAWAVMQQALRGMELVGSEPWAEVREGLARVPPQQRGRAVRIGGGRR